MKYSLLVLCMCKLFQVRRISLQGSPIHMRRESCAQEVIRDMYSFLAYVFRAVLRLWLLLKITGENDEMCATIRCENYHKLNQFMSFIY